MAENPKLLTVKEVVDKFLERGVQRSAKTIYRWADEGEVFRKIHRIGKGGVLIPEDEVERVLRNGNIP